MGNLFRLNMSALSFNHLSFFGFIDPGESVSFQVLIQSRIIYGYLEINLVVALFDLFIQVYFLDWLLIALQAVLFMG